MNDEYLSEETFSVHHKSPLVSDFETETNEEEFHVQEDADSVPNRTTSSPITMKLYKSDELVDSDKKYDGINISHHRCILYSLVCFIIHMHHHLHKHFCISTFESVEENLQKQLLFSVNFYKFSRIVYEDNLIFYFVILS